MLSDPDWSRIRYIVGLSSGAFPNLLSPRDHVDFVPFYMPLRTVYKGCSDISL